MKSVCFAIAGIFITALNSSSAKAGSVLQVTGDSAAKICAAAIGKSPASGCMVQLTHLSCSQVEAYSDDPYDQGGGLIDQCSADNHPSFADAGNLLFALSDAGVPVAGDWGYAEVSLHVTSLSCAPIQAGQPSCQIRLE